MTRLLLVMALVVSSSCGFGWGSTSRAASASGNTIQIKDFAFVPAEFATFTGDTVTWINTDGFMHSVRSDSGAWSSPELTKGGQFTVVAPRPGRYPYHCAAHPTMRGVLLIE